MCVHGQQEVLPRHHSELRAEAYYRPHSRTNDYSYPLTITCPDACSYSCTVTCPDACSYPFTFTCPDSGTNLHSNECTHPIVWPRYIFGQQPAIDFNRVLIGGYWV